MGTSMTATAQHGLLLEKGGKRYWLDYNDLNHRLDGRTLEVMSTIKLDPYSEDTLLNVTRTYTFNDSNIEVEIRLVASQNLSLDKLVEIIPVPVCVSSCNAANVKTNGSKITDSIGNILSGNQTLQTLSIIDDTNRGIDIKFSNPKHVYIKNSGIQNTFPSAVSGYKTYEIGRIEIILPTSWSAGQVHTLTYSIDPR